MNVRELDTDSRSDLHESLSIGTQLVTDVLRLGLVSPVQPRCASNAANGVARVNDEGNLYEGQEKRRVFRFATNCAGVFQRLNPFSVETLEIRIVDVSAGGLRLHVATAIMVGSFCKVRMQDGVAFGPVRYCIPAAVGFFAGIRLDEYVCQRAIRKR